MANIYSRVELFYQENPDAEAIVSQEKVEQYFRRRAWHAASRHDMEREWRLLAQLIAYIDRGEFYSFDSLTAMDYEEVLLRVRETNPEFLLSNENISQAFATWRAFYKIALPDADRSLYDNLQAAEEECLALRDYRQEQQERRDQQEDIVSQFERDGLSTQEMRQMDRQLNDLIEDVQDFYLREDHDADFNRAVYLFWGPEDHPNNPSSELKPEGAWQMFWDYFLFDYHLIGKDDTPFHHYYLECGAGFDRMQRLVAEFFLQARFHVFYVESFAEDYIACRDLLTEEKMELPLQELPSHPNKMIFYGHVYERGDIEFNHVCAVPATKKLRRRIKEEIQRLWEVYRIRFPEATVEEFLSQRTAAVLHVMRLMTSQPQLRVVPTLPAARRRPRAKRKALPENFLSALERLERKASLLPFTREEREIMRDVYCDFVQRAPLSVQVMKRGDTLAAAILTVAMINGTLASSEKEVLRLFRTTSERVRARFGEIITELDGVMFDPRYLSEVGMVNLLYLPPDPEE